MKPFIALFSIFLILNSLSFKKNLRLNNKKKSAKISIGSSETRNLSSSTNSESSNSGEEITCSTVDDCPTTQPFCVQGVCQ